MGEVKKQILELLDLFENFPIERPGMLLFGLILNGADAFRQGSGIFQRDAFINVVVISAVTLITQDHGRRPTIECLSTRDDHNISMRYYILRLLKFDVANIFCKYGRRKSRNTMKLGLQSLRDAAIQLTEERLHNKLILRCQRVHVKCIVC